MQRKIVYLLDNLRMGGAEAHTLALAQALAPELEPVIVAYGLESRSSAALLAHRQMKIRFVGAERLFDLRRWLQLRRILRQERPHVVIAVNQTPLVALVGAASLGRKFARLAWVLHASPSYRSSGRDRLLRPILRWCARQVDLVIFVSENQRKAWSAVGLRGRRELVVHNGVAIDPLDPAHRAHTRLEQRARCGFTAQDVVYGICGGMRPEKDHLTFLRALGALRRGGAPAKGLLVGDGPARPSIEREIQELELQGAVFLTGEVENVQPYLTAMDVGVLCSLEETFSLAALESMAAGLPMVMTEVGGASEMIGDGREGALCRPGDVLALTDAMKRLLPSDERERMGSAGKARAEDAFTYVRMLAGYRAALQELFESRS